MRSTLFSLLILISGIGINTYNEQVPSPHDAEEEAINQAVRDAYAVISYAEGETPDYEAVRNTFTPNATFLNFRPGTLQSYLIDDFVTGLEGMVNNGQITMFYEEEVTGKTEYFGKIAHRISTYVTYLNTRDTVFERGVNSFQLVKIDGEWIINSVIWDVERPTQPIPAKYDNK